jgi:hypothetical protein
MSGAAVAMGLLLLQVAACGWGVVWCAHLVAEVLRG